MRRRRQLVQGALAWSVGWALASPSPVVAQESGAVPAAVESAPAPPAPAESAPAPPAPVESAPVESAPAPPAPVESDRVEERYHEAFQQLARGAPEQAARLLREILSEAPRHPLARRAQQLLSSLEAAAGTAETPGAGWGEGETVELTGAERPSGTARAEMVFFQTLHGIALGAEACVLLECNAAQPWVLSLMLGAGGGFGASWWASSSGVRPGLARALTDGTLFGFANGTYLTLVTETEDARGVAALFALGQLSGLAAGGLLHQQLEPSTGQVSLTSSGGIWLTLSTLQFLGAVGFEGDERDVGATLLAATNLGLLGGALLAAEVPASPGRALLIDGGGLLGMLAGFGVSVLVQGDDVEARPVFGAGLAGTLLGLGLAFHLTQDWDASEPGASAAGSMRAPSLGLMPVAGGLGAALTGRW